MTNTSESKVSSDATQMSHNEQPQVNNNKLGKERCTIHDLETAVPPSFKARIHKFLFNHGLAARPPYLQEIYAQIPRRVYVNTDLPEDSVHQDTQMPLLEMPRNKIRSTKYTPLSFIPKNLFYQFENIANIYFLILVILGAFQIFGVESPGLAAVPLIVIVCITAIKDGFEDFRRVVSDAELNNSPIHLLTGLHNKNVTTDYVSSWRKFKKSCTRGTVKTYKWFKRICINMFASKEKKQEFNQSNYDEQGTLLNPDEKEAITYDNVLLRGCALRNTKWVIGVVVYTGSETKVDMNSGNTPVKKSRISNELNFSVLINFLVLFILCFVSGLINGLFYNREDESRRYFEFEPYSPTSAGNGVLAFFVALIIYQSLVPISLYISIEIIKTAQAFFIHSDIKMYYPKLDFPCIPQSWNISDDLGQIAYIFSDKTGTLTQNVMEFRKCTINGKSYGLAYTEAKQGMDKRSGVDILAESERWKKAIEKDRSEMVNNLEAYVKNDQFRESALKFVSNQYVEDTILPDKINNEVKLSNEKFMLALAVCHTVVTEPDAEDEKLNEFKAESPDEAALVSVARDLGFVFKSRNRTSIELEIYGERKRFEMLHLIGFTSARKRMSCIVRDDDGRTLLICKGADSVIYQRLSREASMDEILKKTALHLEDFAKEGLRTLCIAQKELDQNDFTDWLSRYKEASSSIDDDRDEAIDALNDELECNLELLGGTAIEDRLQEGVPDSISLLGEAGIRLWVLTGDRIETAINIGFSCNLLGNDMRLLVVRVNEDDPENVNHIDNLLSEYLGEVAGLHDQSHANIDEALNQAKKDVSMPKANTALIVDGGALTHVFGDRTEDMMLQKKFVLLGKLCKSVICCRVSPAQKAQVVQVVKENLNAMSLAIGDGANDVAMIQAANVGVGIAGEEGRQAVMSADYAIGQFRFLTRLLLVHGHWSYKKLAEMIPCFFYKNVVFTFTCFWFGIYNDFDGSYLYEYTFLMFYNLAFTSLPVIFLGIFDQDVSGAVALIVPQLYRSGILSLDWSQFKFDVDIIREKMRDGAYQNYPTDYDPTDLQDVERQRILQRLNEGDTELLEKVKNAVEPSEDRESDNQQDDNKVSRAFKSIRRGTISRSRNNTLRSRRETISDQAKFNQKLLIDMFDYCLLSSSDLGGFKASKLVFDNEIQVIADPSWDGNDVNDVEFMEQFLNGINLILLSHSTPEFIGGYALLCSKFESLMATIPVYSTVAVSQLGRVSTVEFYRAKGLLGPVAHAIFEVSDIDEYFDKIISIKRVEKILNLVDATLANGGAVLFPVTISGRFLEILHLIDHHLAAIQGAAIPVYFLSYSGTKVLNYASGLSDWMASNVMKDHEGFQSEDKAFFGTSFDPSKVDLLIDPSELTRFPGPKIVFASGVEMEDGDLSTKALSLLCSDEKTTIILTEKGASSNKESLSSQLYSEWHNLVSKKNAGVVEDGTPVPIEKHIPANFFFDELSLKGTELSTYQAEVSGRRHQKALSKMKSKRALNLLHSSIQSDDSDEDEEMENDNLSDDVDELPLDNSSSNISNITHSDSKDIVGDMVDPGHDVIEAQAPKNDFSIASSTGGETYQSSRSTVQPNVLSVPTIDESYITDFILERCENNKPVDFRITTRFRPRQAMFPILGSKRKKVDDYGEVIDPKRFRKEDEQNVNSRLISESKKKFEEGHGREWGNVDGRRERNRNDRERFLVDSKLTPQQVLNNDILRKYLDTTFNPIKRVRMNRRTGIVIRCGLAFIDFSGYADARSMNLVISSLRPSHLIILPDNSFKEGLQAGIDGAALVAKAHKRTASSEGFSSSTIPSEVVMKSSSFFSQKSLKSSIAAEMQVSVAKPNATIEVGKTGHSVSTGEFEISIDDDLWAELSWRSIDKKYKVAYVSGIFDVCAKPSENGSENSSESIVSIDLKASSASQDLIELDPIPCGKEHEGTQAIGSIRMPELKKKLKTLGFEAEFKGEGTLVVEDAIAIRKSDAYDSSDIGLGDIVIDGQVGPTYYKVRKCIRSMLAYVQ
ncbi:uncharacterized protein CXQ87_004790 [Candidozyma duobushaemuli]|uniref:P-type phospholipid transporter n=1 Tax=Candidozyma duobushaemuli TaxID=1231522 RepID=A0A2V1ADS4_9ASCO|nr:uncharacterized protein CXQ87_004790 [[Candida] duobushaemulonis]PVH16497.1 hypothetical protein CXQ87_004790 [[Candida] duobushaemulonis]